MGEHHRALLFAGTLKPLSMLVVGVRRVCTEKAVRKRSKVTASAGQSWAVILARANLRAFGGNIVVAKNAADARTRISPPTAQILQS